MGRKKITEKDPSFLGRLLEIYTQNGDQRKTASALGVGVKTVRKYLHQEGIYPKRGRRKGKFHTSVYQGAFPRWLRENPGTSLPESPSEIAALSGCTVDEVKTHLYRVRKAIAREIESLPDLRSLEAVVEDTRGIPYPMRAIASYEIQGQKYHRRVKILARLKNGRSIEINTHLDYLWDVIPKGRRI